ncbi:D-sedoheptulose 7-phosphate isomerase [Tunturibacter empetritectus]|uniref:Phosphoheptose isomerase n=1 Tax=Tunturiibacter empetritectus TaxID=3069691 RepID=A0A7W8IFH4_9BACT|nr:D-sedoheptulose 7-phosphate isomerase [Edaphobacter lichenicola]MBB5315366.1 D-sedoheptulose 7-phosphate isomerase [Edaphobacter lichenicola]
MKHLVQKQLAQSIATLQAVLADETISDTLISIAKLTATAMQSGHKLLVAGNGGSAADAQHLVAEFVVRLTVNRPALRAIALTTDTSILTAAGNDYGFDHLFSRQIEALAQPGDVFLAISTSGNSKNIVKAITQAKMIGITTIGLSGNDGGLMRPLCDYNIVIPSAITQNIQESHLALEHIFCMLVEHFAFGHDLDHKPQILSE